MELSNFQNVFDCACGLFREALEQGKPKHKALAQITSGKIATILDMESRNVGTVISKHYSRGDLPVTKTSLLRQDIVNYLIDQEFQLNYFNLEKNPNGTIFSYYDQIGGLKLHPLLGIEQMFLVGIYRTDGNPYNFRKNGFKLSGRTGDEQFYQNVLVNLINDTFNLNVKAHIKPRRRKTKTKTYTWNDVYIYVISQGHFAYLKDYIKLFNKEKEFLPFDVEGLGENEDKVQEYYTAYLMGIVAGGGYIGKRGNRYVLKFHDKEQHFIPEIKRVLDKDFFDFSYSNPRKKPRYLYFNQQNLEKMVSFEAPFRITEDQVGLFVNPRHLNEITKLS